MKMIFIHSDYLEYEPKKRALKNAEECNKGVQRIDECLVVFTAVEKNDERNIENTVKQMVKEIEDVAKLLKTKNIVIYPFAHLSRELAKPSDAVEVLRRCREVLENKFNVLVAPFGWYKSFTIRCKGHPLSELSREFSTTGARLIETESVAEEEKVKSRWYILDKGKLHEIRAEQGELIGYDFSGFENLKKFALYEMIKKRDEGKESPHVKLMRKLEIADYEEGSDPGNLKFYPKGKLIKNLLEDWITEKAIGYGAIEIETPVMYDFEHPCLKDYLDRFPARQYRVESFKKKFFLRFSACFGQFLVASKMNISYKLLPIKIFELAKSFRLEKPGELTGLRRLRAFTMPDMHTLCMDMIQAKQEFMNQFRLCMDCMNDIGFGENEYETTIRFTEDFWKKNMNFIISLSEIAKKPILIEIWNKRFAYFDPKFEFNFVDALGKASALSTVQIDHENAERYGISYVDAKDNKKFPKILHTSPSGGIERCMYAIIEKAYMKNPERSVLPLWLSPVQVRLCPVNDSFLSDAEKIADMLEKENIRVDIDDRAESIGKKVRDAEKGWTPIIIVMGDKERKSNKLTVRFRTEGRETRQMNLKELIKFVKEQTKDKPFRKLSLPRLLSKRPVFVG